MQKVLLVFLVLFNIIACNNNHKERAHKTIAAEDSVSKDDKVLLLTASMYYDDNMCNMALPYYDSLISRYPLNGSFYFKRACCKSKIDPEDPAATADYLKSIELNFSRKELAYLSIGISHQFNGIFRCSTKNEAVAAFDSAIYYYNECLKIDHNNKQALAYKKEVTNNLALIDQGNWPAGR